MEDDDDQNILVNNEVVESHEKRQRFALEPALFVVFFGFNLAMTILPNQLLKQTCLMEGFNVTDCSNLGSNKTKEIEETIQPQVAQIIMTNTLLNSIIPAIISLFLGAWTDKFGRMKVICATCVGFSLTLVSFCVVSYTYEQALSVNPWLYVLPMIPMIMTGGYPSMIVAVLCYISDLSTKASLSTRLITLEVIAFSSVLTAASSYIFIFDLTSATRIFAFSSICVTLATAYIIIFVDESVKVTENAKAFDQIKELASHAPVVDMIRTCFRRRQFNERKLLWCLITILLLTAFTMNGTSNIFYLFTRENFQWTLKDATTFDSITLMIYIIGCFIGFAVKKLLNFSDLTFAFVAIISMIIDSLIKALAQTSSTMYIASGVCVFKVLLSPMCRSLISSVIPDNETGKVFSVTSSFEVVSGLIASPLYTYIYSRTFRFFAGAFYLLTFIVFVINLFLAILVFKMKRTRDNLNHSYTQIES